MINFYLRYDAFTVRKANLEALSSQQIVVPAVANMAALVESSGRCQLKFISPQLQKAKGKVNNFRGLLEIITHSGLRKGLESATHHFLVSRRINLESQGLMSSTVAIYHGVEVKTLDMHGVETLQQLRCTGDKGWYSGVARYDWVWVQIAQWRDG